MYLIKRETPIEKDYICKAIMSFQTKELPFFNRYKKYYDGKQKILQKPQTDNGRTPNKVVCNYCYTIVQNYLGYLMGIPVKYDNDKVSDVLEVLDYNDVHQEDNNLLRQALIYGRAFECNYVDEEGKQRFRMFDTRQCIPVYAADLSNELLYVIRFYEEDLLQTTSNYYVELYGPETVKIFKSTPGWSSIEKIAEYPHFFNQCPVTVFSLNEDEEPIFKQILPLQDAYNQLLSDEIDDFDAFADAYLLIKGAMGTTDEDITRMKKDRVLLMDNDADARYLTKSISDTQIQNMLENVNKQIYKISNSPDFSDEKFFASSGIALRYKLVGFENVSADIEAYMKKALTRRIELISEILNIKEGEKMWRDVDIVFTRNLPQTLFPSNPTELMQYKGLVSNKTLLSQLPFVKDVEEELALVKSQNEKVINNMASPVIENNNEQEGGII